MLAQQNNQQNRKQIMCISKQFKSTRSQHLKELKELVGLGFHPSHSNNTSHQLGKIQL
jgi:hypothetical protein